MIDESSIALVFALAVASCTTSDRADFAGRDWPAYLGDAASSQYSTLDQIDATNVDQLEIAWSYRTGDVWHERFSQIQTNPLVIDGVLYGATPSANVFALDAATGRELWRFEPDVDHDAAGGPPRHAVRGLATWSDGTERRVFFGKGFRLYAVDAATGHPIASFGSGGRVDLRNGLGRDPMQLTVDVTTPGVVFEELLIQGTRVGESLDSAPGHIRAYDVRTGEIVWTFHTIPHPGEYGYETWPPDAWERVGGANNWSGMSLDRERGIVYIPTGSAAFDFWGGDRVGQNLFANTLLALDARTGERIWHYQTVRHDIWDRDLPAPPNLVTIERDGRRIDAVAQVTKSGFVFVFGRETGEPLFPIEERDYPASTLRGEETWPTQPFPTAPPPFSRQRFDASLVSDIGDETHGIVIDSLRRLTSDGQFIPFDTAGTIIFPGFDGGAAWGGAAVDPDGILYVNANEMPWVASLSPVTTHPEIERATSLGALSYAMNCASCHGSDRRGGSNRAYPNLVESVRIRSTVELRAVIVSGHGFMPGFRRLPDDEIVALLAYLSDTTSTVGADALTDARERYRSAAVPYTFDGYHRFVDGNGNPVVEPPWGTLTAIDLNTGAFRWRIPLGELPELTARGIPPTGTENYGGPVVTAGGVLFIAATKDEMFRAFSAATGELLWESKLPAGGYATPASYMVGDRQYVVVAAGGGKMGTDAHDEYVAYALPPNDER